MSYCLVKVNRFSLVVCSVGNYCVVTDHQQPGQEWSQKTWEDLILKVLGNCWACCYLLWQMMNHIVDLCLLHI